MHEINNLYYRKYYPVNDLTNLIKYTWIMKCFESTSKPDLLIPDGYPEIIFVQKGAYKKEFLNPDKASIIINRSCIIGIQTQSILASRVDHCHLIGLKLKPTGAYQLFGDRLKSTADINVHLSDFGVKWLYDLNQQLKGYEEDTIIVELLTDTLLKQLEQSGKNQSHELAASFLDSILRLKGQISVQELADQHFLSIRHFQRKFKAFFGVSPKKFLNIIRFKHLYKSSILKEKLPKNFLDFGYYDQMHFIKDFQKHLGVNPSNSSNSEFVQMNEIARLSK